jgi:hypothetical protein
MGNDKLEMWGDLQWYDVCTEHYEEQVIFQKYFEVCLWGKCICLRQHKSKNLFYGY